jgi:very-short-patch-repair endonuclease
MEEAGPEIRKLKPCFMMSPLSVSQFIPSRMRFDAVIFDEASQVKPEDAINSIYRGAQLIVAGDRNQLPPTSFFEQTQDQGDEYLGDDEASSWESVLDLCTGNAAFREIPLLWHYRSRHEHLIAFSNHVFYDGRLVTFPGAMNEGGDVGVEFFHVPDGIYRRNLTRDNEKEARFVSERVIHHLAHHRDLTIGIVALSEPQASMIEQILEIALANHPELRERMRKDRLDGLFVKNLETVQGDERDLIILSVGYGHDANGILTQNFGPMNQKNGWRRLNVAITRARKRIEVIASIMPSEIIDSGGERSIVFLRKYLEYASSNTSRLEVIGAMFGSGKQERESPFEDSIAHAIVKMGYSVETQVGCSGYRMDIAVRHPQDPSQYVLAVECDGATYHSTKVVRDRDRLRQEVLKGLGWDVWRIWSSSWYQSRRTQEQLLEKAIQDAVSRHPVTNVTAFSPAVSQTEKEQIALGTGTYVQGSESSSVQDIIEDISKQESTEREVAENPYPQEDPVDIIASVSPSRSTAYHAPPRNLSVESLVAYLESFGFSVDNKRPLGGSLWVYLSEERFSEMSEILRANGIVLKFYPHGRTRKPGEQWEIDPGKRLG